MLKKNSFKANQFPASREESISIWSEPDLGVFFAVFCSDKDILAEVIWDKEKHLENARTAQFAQQICRILKVVCKKTFSELVPGGETAWWRQGTSDVR